MSGLTFSFDNTKATSTVINRLEGNDIYDVEWKGAEAATIENKTTNEKYEVLRLKFEGEKGIFEDTLFEPKKGDEVRKDNDFGYKNPSNIDELMFKIKHLFAAVAPKVAQQIEDKGGLAVGSWDELRKFVVKHTEKAVGAKTQIKLFKKTSKDGKTSSAVFPSFVLGFNKKNELYPKTNFIGANLAFTAKEVDRIKAAATATPTNMAAIGGIDLETPAAAKAKSDEIDLDGILDL